MSLTILDDLEQGSDEWFAARRGMVTASVVGTLLTAKTLAPANNDKARDLTAMLVAERITGHTDDTFQSYDMLRGKEDEPRAVAVYSDTWAPVTTAGFMVRDDWGWPIGYSPDGLVGDDGLIEVKSRRAKLQLTTVLDGIAPPEHMAQIQCGLLVSGRDWCDYVSYSGGMPMWRKRVEPEQQWFDAILTAVDQFEQTAAEMVARYSVAVEGLPTTERPVIEMVI